jgi:hypothetical protein
MPDDEDVRRALRSRADGNGGARDAGDVDEALDRRVRSAHSRRRRRLGIALGAVGLATAWALAATATDHGSTPDIAGEVSTTGPGPTTVAPPSTNPDDELAVGVTDDGRLVVIDTASRSIVRTLARDGDPRSDHSSATDPGYISTAAPGPDGTVLYTTCCEPTSGSVHRIPPGGGAPSLVSDGSQVSVSPTGTIAIADPGLGIKVFEALDRAPDVVALPHPSDVDWDSTGTRLVVTLDPSDDAARSSYAVVLVDLRDPEHPQTRQITAPPDVTWSQARFGPEDHLFVIERPRSGPTRVRRLDADGADAGIVELDGRTPQALGSSRDRSRLLVAFRDGGIASLDGSGVVGPTSGGLALRSIGAR